jgi:hypothetical protein
MTAISLFNPGFENGVSADVQQTVICTQNVGTVSVDAMASTGLPHTGSWAAKWNPNVGAGINTLQIKPKQTGQATSYIPSERGTHTFSFWAKVNLAQGDHTLTLRLRAYDAANTLLQETNAVAAGTIPVGTSWAQFTVTQSPVDNTAFIQPIVDLNLTVDLNNASFFFDDVALDVVPEAAPPPEEPGEEPRPGLMEFLRLEVQKARNDALVLGVSTVTGYHLGGPADTAESGMEWLDVLGTSHDIKIRRGGKRDGIGVTIEAGTLNATVFNSQVDPNTNPYIKPGTPMRLVYNAGIEDIPVFNGVISNVQVTYTGKKPTVFLSAVDRVKDLSNINRSGVVAGTYAQRVDTLLSKHGIPFNVYGGVSSLAQNAYDSTLLNHMTLATNSEDGRFFVDRENVIQAYGHDAVPEGTVKMSFADQRFYTVTNRIPNPAFETNQSRWNQNAGSRALDTSWFAGGSQSLKYTVTTSSSSNNYLFPQPEIGKGINNDARFAIGRHYYIRATIKAGQACQIAIKVNGYDADNLGSGTVLPDQRWDFAAGEVKTVEYVSDVTDINDATVGVTPLFLIYEAGDGNTAAPVGYYFNIDNVMMVIDEGDPADYFDGSSGNGSWTGVPYASESTGLTKRVNQQEYNDIVVRYDSASLFNDIYINNLTYGLSEDMEPVSVSTKYGPFRNVTSIATFGAYTKEIDTNLSTELAVSDYAAEVLDRYDAPSLSVEQIRFNAKGNEDKAAALEVYDKVNVEYSNETIHIGEDFNVVAIEHTITASQDAHKWMVDVDLISKEDI